MENHPAEITDDEEIQNNIEKPKKPHGLTGRPMTDIQKANLQKGRDARIANKALKDKASDEAAYQKVKAQIEPPTKQIPTIQAIKKKKAKQVIVIQSDSESDDDAPQIIIRHKKKVAPAPPPPEPVYEPVYERQRYQSPIPRIRLKRV